MSHDTYEKKAKKLARVYRKALFNKEMYGDYLLRDMLDFDIANEENLIPINQRSKSEQRIKSLYMGKEDKTMVSEAQSLNISLPTAYKFTNRALYIIGRRLFDREEAIA